MDVENVMKVTDKCRIMKEGRVIGKVEYLDDSGGYADGVLTTMFERYGEQHEGAEAKVWMDAGGSIDVRWDNCIEVPDVEDLEDALLAVRATISAIVIYAEWSTHVEAKSLPDGVTLEFY